MKFVVILVIVVILTVLKREACQTGEGQTGWKIKLKKEKKPCGKGQTAYNSDGFETLTNQQIIEQVLPWTVLTRTFSETGIFLYSVGVLIDETIAVVSPHATEIPDETAKAKEEGVVQLFLAKHVAEYGLTDDDGLNLDKAVALPNVWKEGELDTGGLVKLSAPVSENPPIQPVCKPETFTQTYSECRIVGWRIEKDGGRFSAKVFKPDLLSVTDCKKMWGDGGVGICAKSDDMMNEIKADNDDSKFAYGPLVCYDKHTKTWSLDGLARLEQDESGTFRFLVYKQYLETKSIKEQIKSLKKPVASV